MQTSAFAVVFVVGLSACTEAPDSVGPATTGIYQLQVRGLVETCDPAGELGDYTVGLFRTDTALNYAYPGTVDELGTMRRRDTGADLRDESDVLLSGTCAQGRRHHTFAAQLETPERVEATLAQRWDDVIHCASDPFDAELPVAACSSQRILTYQLVEPCEAPCQIVDTTGGLACQC